MFQSGKLTPFLTNIFILRTTAGIYVHHLHYLCFFCMFAGMYVCVFICVCARGGQSTLDIKYPSWSLSAWFTELRAH